MARPQNKHKKQIQEAICRHIATSNLSLGTILKNLTKNSEFDPKEIPVLSTVWEWMDTDEEFSDKYARAKRQQCEFLAEEILEISDDSSLDVAFTEDGKPFVDKEHINRSRLRVDTRKWILSKLKPKKYGDKQQVEFPDESGKPQQIGGMFSDMELAARLVHLVKKAQDAKRSAKD